MNSIVSSIVAELDTHIQTLQAAKAAIIGSTQNSKPSRSVATAKPRKRKQMSAAARKRIGDAQKKRWAEKRKANKVVTK
jgi:hypothetical protein